MDACLFFNRYVTSSTGAFVCRCGHCFDDPEKSTPEWPPTCQPASGIARCSEAQKISSKTTSSGHRVFDATVSRHIACCTVSGIHQTFCQQGILVTTTEFPDVFAHQMWVPAWQSEWHSNCETGGRSKMRQTSDALVMKPTTDRNPIAARPAARTNDLTSSRVSRQSGCFTESSRQGVGQPPRTSVLFCAASSSDNCTGNKQIRSVAKHECLFYNGQDLSLDVSFCGAR